jgi:hypothetical protein
VIFFSKKKRKREKNKKSYGMFFKLKVRKKKKYDRKSENGIMLKSALEVYYKKEGNTIEFKND